MECVSTGRETVGQKSWASLIFNAVNPRRGENDALSAGKNKNKNHFHRGREVKIDDVSLCTQATAAATDINQSLNSVLSVYCLNPTTGVVTL